ASRFVLPRHLRQSAPRRSHEPLGLGDAGEMVGFPRILNIAEYSAPLPLPIAFFPSHSYLLSFAGEEVPDDVFHAFPLQTLRGVPACTIARYYLGRSAVRAIQSAQSATASRKARRPQY